MTRTFSGKLILPEDMHEADASDVLIEVRDVSLADAPSVVIAEKRLGPLPLRPGEAIEFTIEEVPEVEPRRRLSVRIHVDLDGSGRVTPGDLLTTTSNPVPAVGTPEPLEIRVTLI